MAEKKEYFCETTEQVYNILERSANFNGIVLIDEGVSKMLTLQALSTKAFDDGWNQILYAEFNDESVTLKNADPKLRIHIHFGKKMKTG